jgi:hypothetical protein
MVELLATEANGLLADFEGVMAPPGSNIIFVWAVYRNPEGTANAYVSALAVMAVLVSDFSGTFV